MVDLIGADSPPSFEAQISVLRNYRASMQRIDKSKDLVQNRFGLKLRNYELAQSHGIRIPHIVGSWLKTEDVQFDQLPEFSVLKTDGGSSGYGVLLLQRLSETGFRIVGTDEVLTPEEIVARFKKRYSEGRIYGAIFCESFLFDAQREDQSIPEDIKFYMAYGHVMHVLVRRVDKLRDQSAVYGRYLDADGKDLGEVSSQFAPTEGDFVCPSPWAEMVRTAEHMSFAAGTPFMRVDLYAVGGKVFLGELTPSPGGQQRYAGDVEGVLGQMWTDAAVRLDIDVANGRPRGPIYGGDVVKDLYPRGHQSHGSSARRWHREAFDCNFCSV